MSHHFTSIVDVFFVAAAFFTAVVVFAAALFFAEALLPSGFFCADFLAVAFCKADSFLAVDRVMAGNSHL